MGRKRFDPKGKANIFKMNRELRERVKFKLSIDRLKKCRLMENGYKEIHHKMKPGDHEMIDHGLLGKIVFCKKCKGIIFRGNKKWKNL